MINALSRIKLLLIAFLFTRGDQSTGCRMSEFNGEAKTAIGGGAINEKPRLYSLSSNPSPTRQVGSIDPDSSSWSPGKSLGHMLHALVGLDRYPNYLSRFQHIYDVEALESALKEKLDEVTRQKNDIIAKRKGIHDLVCRYNKSIEEKRSHEQSHSDTDDAAARTDDTMECSDSDCSNFWHSELSPPTSWSELKKRKILNEDAFKVAFQSMQTSRHRGRELRDFINGDVDLDLNPSLLEQLMNQEMFDVYSFPLLSTQFCYLLRKTVRDLSDLCESDTEFQYLKLGHRPIDLDSIGLGWVNDMLFNLFIRPMTKHLFAKSEQLQNTNKSRNAPSTLDWRHGYVAGYSSLPNGSKGATRHRLVPHTDDSEITLNCCLGEENYVGGHVEFYGLRGSEDEGQLIGKVERPNVGTALLHSGRHLHSVSEVTNGDRYALIIWSRSWSCLRKDACPCCYLNRRQDKTCICAPRWN
eukprot:CCRYP_010283-RA/>CCRYP_010283-RA protein AED:0.02 eAED:0.02 QI:107/1/1/1/1/1/2/91/468